MKNIILLCFSLLFCSLLFAQNTIIVNINTLDYFGSPISTSVSIVTDSTDTFSYYDFDYTGSDGNTVFTFTAPVELPTGEMTIYIANNCEPDNGSYTLEWTEENTTFDINYELCLAPCTGTLDFDESTGGLTASFLNGEAPYIYNWNTGATDATIYPNSSGYCCVSMQDAGGCNFYQCYYFDANPEGDSLCTLFIDTLINTNLEVELTANVTGEAPFTYQWSTGETTPTIIGEGQTIYCVTVTDATGCNRFECRNTGYVPECYSVLNYNVEDNELSVITYPLNQIFNYTWSTGETGSTITPSESGYYSVETSSNCGTNVQYYIDYGVRGQIFIEDSTEITSHGATVYAIQYDETLETLTELETTDAWSINEGQTTMEYEFEDLGVSTYLLKAALQSESPYYNTHLPTYYPGVLYWNEAEEVSFLDYATFSYDNIVYNYLSSLNWTLQAGENLGGPGFIEGAVSDGANLTEKTGEPMEGVTVILEDETGNPIAFDYTNADGKYKFTNLALGTYRIAIDIINYPVGEKWVTLSEGEMSSEENNFSVTEEEISTSIFNAEKELKHLVSITPNPANDVIFVDIMEETNNFTSYEIINATGQKVMSSTANSFRNNSEIDISRLKSGVYFLRINQEDNKISVGRFIKN